MSDKATQNATDPEVPEALRAAIVRQFPTATCLVLHPQLIRRYSVKVMVTHCFAYDALGRTLLPLRPLEWSDLQRQLDVFQGYVVFHLSATRPAA